mgnify:CR=1 FL=1
MRLCRKRLIVIFGVVAWALTAGPIPAGHAADSDDAPLTHWAFNRPLRPDLPAVENKEWPRQGPDCFILSRVESAGAVPAPMTDRARRIRRATLDLTGLPPTLHQLDAFLQDESENAWEKAIDRLLASPRYGERMAVIWLDLARYADTDGYQDDEPRTMWRWREWLIDALNDNLPLDQFTVEVLAGDLLPDSQPEQVLATGFLRNNRTNGEGGSIAEEFRVEYTVDRLETVGSTWLGLTVGCARCHDHKYDPLSQKEFYELFAFFNQIPENPIYRRSGPPTIKVPSRSIQYRLDAIDELLKAIPAESTRGKQLTEDKENLLKQVPDTMIMADGEPRETYVLNRGQYDNPGIQVSAGVPASLPPLPDQAPRNRLGLARWLMDSEHPMTSRVIANRFWSILFGVALVDTADDFGIQGDLPANPDLLDWLARELPRLDWDVKNFQRMMMTSATYQQSSRKSRSTEVPPSRYSPFPRKRLSAEIIRDQALAVSGLLVERLGGPSVKPYQPDGLWGEIAGVSTSQYSDGYQVAKGSDLYRRSLYTFWRRTIHPPGMEVFDAPSREICATRRQLTNTPLQALALLNDTIFVEASKGLGTRMIHEGGKTLQERTRFGFRTVMAREPVELEMNVLVAGTEKHLAHYRSDEEAALQLVQIGESAPDATIEPTELAAYMALANTLLNLDEAINRE